MSMNISMVVASSDLLASPTDDVDDNVDVDAGIEVAERAEQLRLGAVVES